MEKRGLSDVVTTVLIILLVLAAVVIIWSFVRPAIQSGGEKIGTGGACVQLELSPTLCTGAGASVTVKREADDATLKTVALIYADESGNTKRIDQALTAGQLDALESHTFTGVVTTGITATSVTVAGVVTTESGQEVTCPSNDVPATCAA